MSTSVRMNEKDAAAYLEMSVKWLQKGRCEGFGPRFIKMGRAIRYDRSELDRYMASRTINPAV